MSKLIPSDVVKAIQDSVQPSVIKIDGIEYTSKSVHLPPREPQLEPIKIHTLTGFINYIKSTSLESGIIHVVSPTKVALTDLPMGRYRDRDIHAVADCSPIIGNGFQFGIYQALEQFIVNLQSQFEPTDTRALILRVVGNMRQEHVKTMSDDGVTQQVVTSAGISRVQNAEVPNPVLLKPFRTFREVIQPESAFVLRLLQGKEGEMPKCALFEADGGYWKLDAIYRIRDHLADRLPDSDVVA
jgi:hypothetical protein